MTDKGFIGIGIIGAGFARTTQIPAFGACEGARAVAIASARRESAEAAAQEFGIPHVADDWREVVRHDEVDLVSIVTPPVTHCEMALAALDAGKHVLCEKPMAMNAREAAIMKQRAHERKVLALIDHELRFLPGRRRAFDILRRGDLGAVRHAKLTFRSDFRASADAPWNWWSDEKAGGGILGALGSHAVDSFRWLLGAEVLQVFANLATHVKERHDPAAELRRFVTADDECNLLLRFSDGPLLANGATGAVSLSSVEAGAPEHRLEIYGEKGALMVEDNGELWLSNAGDRAWRYAKHKRGDFAPGLKPSGWSRGFTAFAKLIVKALQEGRTTLADAATFDDGHRAQLVLDAARRAHEEGRWAKPEQLKVM
jgi:predicted dehydrogenase